MTTTVLLVRHGQTESNVEGYYMGWLDEDINQMGYAQARALSARLANQPIDIIYTSPLRRTFNTASVLAEPHKLEPKVLDDLIEIHQGDWEGMHVDKISQGWPEQWRHTRTDPTDFTMPNGESFKEVTERSVRAFYKIVADNPDRQVVLVAHEIVVKVIIVHTLGATNSIYRHFDLSNASLSVIRVAEGKPHLVVLNDTTHLDGIKG
ncbi:MAG: histidine phosphatase family protein [Chloroflexi bacterium]|nr:histidine phosphatase family protein [Chloroflexota bacterium]